MPAIYKVLGGGADLYLLAFSTRGSLLRQQEVTYHGQVVTGDDGGILSTVSCILTFCYFAQGFHSAPSPVDPVDLLPSHLTLPMGGTGIFTFAGGGLPWVVVNDPWEHTASYTYSPTSGFAEMFRKTDAGRAYAASPLLLPDWHSVTAASYGPPDALEGGHLVFTGPNGAALANAGNFRALLATPARTADQRLVLASEAGEVIFLQNATVLSSTRRRRRSVAE